jgi:hypothetical protein
LLTSEFPIMTDQKPDARPEWPQNLADPAVGNHHAVVGGSSQILPLSERGPRVFC